MEASTSRGDPQARLRAFAERVDYAPHTVFRHRSRRWRYVPTYPFSDETELLGRLGIAASDCRRGEAYWETDRDAVLLRIWPYCEDPLLDPGLYACWVEGESPILRLVAVVPDEVISRTAFEAAMAAFADGGFLADEEAQGALGLELEAVGRLATGGRRSVRRTHVAATGEAS